MLDQLGPEKSTKDCPKSARRIRLAAHFACCYENIKQVESRTLVPFLKKRGENIRKCSPSLGWLRCSGEPTDQPRMSPGRPGSRCRIGCRLGVGRRYCMFPEIPPRVRNSRKQHFSPQKMQNFSGIFQKNSTRWTHLCTAPILTFLRSSQNFATCW